jgi:secreted PhoX family phosphatase
MHGDEIPSNFSANPTLLGIVDARPDRRSLMRGGLSAAVAAFLGTTVLGSGPLVRSAAAQSRLLGFKAVPISTADRFIVPPGYRTQVLIPHGQPITGAMPAFALGNTGAEQAMQVGAHHDGMHFFPIEGRSPYQGSSEDGLLVVNHEYVEPRFMHASAAKQVLDSNKTVVKDGKRDDDEVLKEVNAHGVSVVRIKKQASGQWAVERDARNRRITGQTPMELAGPVRGHDLVKTRFSPDGTRTRGTLNNCAHGVSPWNTYLTCEENWAGYFKNTDQKDQKPDLPREQARYGIRNASRYGWELAASGADEFARFDASAKGAAATADYRNEPNTFGWVVEINPWDPNSTPVKRTGLGRFAHEAVIFAPPVAGRPVVCYSGDDSAYEYIYKFVSAAPYDAATASGALLDSGTLYVAKFNNDGSGEWLALVLGQNGLTPENGFRSQAEILVNARLAADRAGATKMDRPEWGAVDPNTGEIYFSLTNNTGRKLDEVNAANPRAKNDFGHIIRWTEANNDHTSRAFRWSIFVLSGDAGHGQDLAGKPLGEDAIHGSPDGLWFDPQGRLWIQSDVSESTLNKGAYAGMGNNQMLAADPKTGEIRRFLVGPVGQEITGVTATPDGRTMFVNVQHPGAETTADDFASGKLSSHWPDGGSNYPRSATVVITKDDNGVIGT